MVDPVTAVSLVVTVYQIASEVTKICINYAQGIKNANKESDALIDEISLFQRSLRRLKGMLEEEEARREKTSSDRLASLREMLCGETGYLPDCKGDLEKLMIKLEKGKSSNPLKATVHRLAWPLKEDQISRTMERLRQVAETIDRAVNMDVLEGVQAIDLTTKEINVTTKDIDSKTKDIDSRTKAINTATQNIGERQKLTQDQKEKEDAKKKLEDDRQQILQWLTHPDQAENHNIACKARNNTAKTGRWFLESDRFRKYRELDRPVLWLHGDPGCGKTVLTSAIIEELHALRKGDTRMEVAYWYFSTTVRRKGSLDKLVRALISQFIPEGSAPKALLSLWKEKSAKEAPKTSDLIKAVYSMLSEQSSRSFFIVLDALDEADPEERDELLNMLKTISQTESVKSHVLVTSRTNVTSVEQEFSSLAQFYNISIEREHVDHDINAHISERLQNDKILKRWEEPERELIKSTLADNAAGMFRWVDCQLQAIRQCGKKKQLRKTLATLPKDLDEQYRRDLENIDEKDAEDALKLLQWLAFPQRKLRLEEAVDMIAVDFDEDPPTFDAELRLQVPEKLLELCGGLVRPDTNPEGRDELGAPAEVRTLTTAHSTVLDFLKKQPVKIGPCEPVHFRRGAVNMRMAETCLVYLRYFTDGNIELDENNVKKYPFARLCAEYWDDHFRECIASDHEDLDMSRLEDMAMDLLQSPQAMLRLVRLCDPDNDTDRADFDKSAKDVKPALYYASLLGLPTLVRRLIEQGADVNEQIEGGCGTALVAAAKNGRKEIVEILLANDADPNLAGNVDWGTPLAAAVEMDNLEIVKILSKQRGVDLNSRRNPSVLGKKTAKGEESDESEKAEKAAIHDGGGMRQDQDDNTDEEDDLIRSGESIVYIAAAYNSPNTFKWLMDNGADPNIQGGYYASALESACRWGQTEFALSLLEHGANPNIYGGFYGSPLQAASHNGLGNVVKRMLEHGADLHWTGGNYHSCLIAAAVWGREEVVDVLLEAGAKDDLYGSAWDNALQAAACGGFASITKKLLLLAGGDANRQGGQCSTALYGACTDKDYLEVVKVLLENGADPNIQNCGDCDNALQKACEGGYEEVVRALISHGADPMLRGGHYDNTLQAACGSRNVELVKYLLDLGVDPYWEGGTYFNSLQASIACSKADVVQVILDHGVSPNLKGGTFTYPIMRAASGVDDPEYEAENYDPILRLLLERGADPNAEREGEDDFAKQFRTALQHTSSPSMTRILVEAGADINANKGAYGTALHAALGISWKRPSLPQVLIDLGANVNVIQWQYGTPLGLVARDGGNDRVNLLLENGADLELSDIIGHTPIMKALIFEHINKVEDLHEKGAKLLTSDNRGCRPIHYASRLYAPDCLNRILKEGEDCNVADDQGWTPLHWAAASGYKSTVTVETLLKAGATAEVEDRHGWTPLKLAEVFKRDRAIALLKREEDVPPELPLDERKEYMRNFEFKCDGCGDERGIGDPEVMYHCTECISFDFCFRCMMDRDTIHPKDHEFITTFRYRTETENQGQEKPPEDTTEQATTGTQEESPDKSEKDTSEQGDHPDVSKIAPSGEAPPAENADEKLSS